MSKLIVVTIGDIKGIGIEILIREWKNKKIKDFVLVTNYILFKKYIASKNFSIKLFKCSIENNKLNFSKNNFNIYDIKASNYDENTFASIKNSYKLTKNKYSIGIVTLPINKKKINKFDSKFIDQTTYFTKIDGKIISNMIFIYRNIFFVPLTIHIKLKNVSNEFKQHNKFIKKIKSLNFTLLRDFKINNPKYIMAGINPHNGENGIISNEDIKYLPPIINNLKKNFININGPISPDSIVNKKNLKSYNCFIFTYHDQALIPFKLISNYSGVNYTSNLDIIRVSPDHGTAYDMVGKKNQSSQGVINSFKLIKQIALNRIKYDNTQKITKSKFSN
jgi:4-hydroxythreonine-4-phosphate dehydrogenase